MDNYNKFLNNQTSSIIRNNIYNFDEPIEITNLPICMKNSIVDYGLNINLIVNDNISIYQTIIDPLLHTVNIDNISYNLLQIEWRKTNFTFNNINVGLTLHLIHSSYDSVNKLIIVIPLDFVDNSELNDNLEGFRNIKYYKMDSYLKNHIPEINDENILMTINKNIETINKYNLKLNCLLGIVDLL